MAVRSTLPSAIAFALALSACAGPRPVADRPAVPQPDSPDAIPLYTTEVTGPPYTELGPVEAQERLGLSRNVRAADEALRRALRQQAARAGADAVLDVTFTEQLRWLPPLPPSTTPRREVRRVARGKLVRYSPAPAR
jgi:hypothetical protein